MLGDMEGHQFYAWSYGGISIPCLVIWREIKFMLGDMEENQFHAWSSAMLAKHVPSFHRSTGTLCNGLLEFEAKRSAQRLPKAHGAVSFRFP